MKIYHFTSTENYYFAQATRLGTWYPQNSKLCPECNTSRQKRVSPLIIEWEPGSDIVGDFVWPGLNTELVVVQRVKDAFYRQFREIEFALVEFWQNPKIIRPIRITCRSKPRVWLPYSGPILWEVIPKKWCHVDHARSAVTIAKECSTCGKTLYQRPPWNQRHLIIDPDAWNGEDIFHIYEYSGVIFCTERVKDLINQAGFTNVNFEEDGEILE
jgi:hypothetical protein